MAVSYAKRHLDVRFFWELMRVLPAAEAAAGDMNAAETDVMRLSAHVDDVTESGHGEVDQLRLDLSLGQPCRRGHPFEAREPDAAKGVEHQQVRTGRLRPGHVPAPRGRGEFEAPTVAAAWAAFGDPLTLHFVVATLCVLAGVALAS